MQDPQEGRLVVPPNSVEAEQAVLGGLMLAPGAYDRVADIITEADFYRHDHQLIYRAIRELAEKSQPYDAVTLGEWFESMGMGEHIADGAYLTELASTTPSAANIVAYANIVRDKATRRNLMEIGNQLMLEVSGKDGRKTAEIVAKIETRIVTATRAITTTTHSGREGLSRTYREIERRLLSGDKMLGISTSLDGVDNLTQGLQDTDLIILAARPGMGKTAFMRQMARAAAMQGKVPYTCEMEMSSNQIYMRDIAAMASVDLKKVRCPSMSSPEEMVRIREAIARMRDWEWYMDDAAALTVDELTAKLRRMKAQHNIGIAFVDYLQMMNPGEMRHGPTLAIQEITRALKGAAKSLNMPIVLLSQLNRSVESRTDKRPMMSDLRDSGAIEQDADIIMFLYRQGYYEKDWPRDDVRHEQAEVIVGKSRNGEPGSVPVQWLGRYQRFNNLHYGALRPNYNQDPRVEAKRGFEPVSRTGLTGGREWRED